MRIIRIKVEQKMKTKEELNAIKEEINAMNKKLHELTSEELNQVTGGTIDFNTPVDFTQNTSGKQYENHIYTIETEESAREKFMNK